MADDNTTDSIESIKARIALQEVEVGLLREKKEFLADDQAIQESKLELAKQRLIDLRQEILDKETLSELSEDEKESLQLRLKLLQQNVQLEGARLENIQKSQAAAEQLNSVTSNYLGILTGINDGYKDTLLGSMAEALMSAEGLEGAFQKMGESIRKLPMKIFMNVLGEIEQQTIGMISNLFQAQADLTKATGLVGEKFSQQIQDLGGQFSNMGMGIEEATSAIGSLYTKYSNFRNLDKSAQDQLKVTVMEFEGLGIAADTAVPFLDNLTKSLGMSRDEAKAATRGFVAMSHDVKFTAEELMSAFQDVNQDLAAFGDKAIPMFQRLAKVADKTGASLKGLVAIAKQFDTFKGAAEAVGKLNTLMGGNFLDMQNLMRMGYDERIQMIRKTVQARMGSFDSMTQQQKLFVANALGASSVEEAMKLLNNQVEKGEDELKKYGLSNEKVAEIAKASQTPMKVMTAALQKLAIQVQPLITWLAEAAGAVADFISENADLIKVVAAVGASLMLIFKIASAIKAVGALFTAAGAAATTAQATANSALATSLGAVATAATAAAGPMGALTAASAPFLLIIGLIVVAVTVMVVALLDFMKVAIQSGVGMGELAAGISLIAIALGAMGAGLAFVGPGILLMAGALVALGLGLLFVSTKDLQALAGIFTSIAKVVLKNPFKVWTDGLTTFAKKADTIANDLGKFQKTLAGVTEVDKKTSGIIRLITSISKIDSDSVDGIRETKELISQMNYAFDSANIEKLESLIAALTKANKPSKSTSEKDIVLKLDGDVLGKYIRKTVGKGINGPGRR